MATPGHAIPDGIQGSRAGDAMKPRRQRGIDLIGATHKLQKTFLADVASIVQIPRDALGRRKDQSGVSPGKLGEGIGVTLDRILIQQFTVPFG